MTERAYASSECPYCGIRLAPLPKAKKRCPACRRPVYVRLGPDGVRYLLQEVDLPTMDALWAEFDDQRAGESKPMASPSRSWEAARSKVFSTSFHPRAGGPRGLAKVTSSRRENSFFLGSGSPFTNASSAR